MNWYQHIMQNLSGSREVLDLARNISNLFIRVDRGDIIDEHSIHNIVSKLPSEVILQKAIKVGLQLSSLSTGIRDMTSGREEVVRRINESLQNVVKDDNIEENNNELVEENYTGDNQTPEVQQEI